MPEAKEELLTRLAGAVACARERAELVGQLRRMGVTFDVIRDRTGVPFGTAHRWARQYEKTQIGEEQG